MKTLKFASLALVMIVLSSCSKDRFTGGPIVIEDRIIEDEFTGIVLDASLDLIVIDTDEFDIRLECAEKKIQHINTNVVGDNLIIKENTNAVINDNDNKIYVAQTILSKILIDGSGDVEADLGLVDEFDLEINGSGDADLDLAAADEVTIKISGSGDVDFSGDANVLSVTIDGSGDVNAKFLETTEASVYVNGSGDSYVNATDFLDAFINGSGDIYYLNSPEIDLTDNGSGDLIEY